MYFVLFVVFIALIVGPVVVGRIVDLNIDIPMDLLQPVGLNNNDTGSSVTGSCVYGVCPAGPGGGRAKETDTNDKLRRFVAF